MKLRSRPIRYTNRDRENDKHGLKEAIQLGVIGYILSGTFESNLRDQDEIIFAKGKYTFFGRLSNFQFNALLFFCFEQDLF